MKIERELYAFRRHVPKCPFFGPGGRDVRQDKCNCPFHVDGIHQGQRLRQSLNTRSRQIADRRVTEIIRDLDVKAEERDGAAAAAAGVHPTNKNSIPQERTLSDAVRRFLRVGVVIGNYGKFRGDLEYGTWRKYRNSLRLFSSFCDAQRISSLADVKIDHLEDFRATRAIGAVTWKVELQTLRTFFAHCVSHHWVAANPARDMKPPRNIKPNEVVPYTLLEESLILRACDLIGGGRSQQAGPNYERLRARAMVLVLRHTALRVSDVCTLRRDAISWDQDKGTWRTLVRTQKTGEPVYLPIPDELKLALDAVPLPRNAARDCPFYFWNAVTSRRAVVGITERTLSTVFKKSGVKNAHAHRFRHTLATRLLGADATYDNVADILGNTAEVVRKHYGKWSSGRQDKIDELMFGHFQTAATSPVTSRSHEKTGAVN
jgi:site-specific recombinase XerD